MVKDIKNKKVAVGVSLGILLVFSICLSFSYAYWQITRTQKGTNEIVAACLDLELVDEKGSFSLEKAWPINDEEGSLLEG